MLDLRRLSLSLNAGSRLVLEIVVAEARQDSLQRENWDNFADLAAIEGLSMTVVSIGKFSDVALLSLILNRL